MEIGHNILHGQWDWMRDPSIHSSTWEWDSATPAEQWKHSHNELHHTYTNVIGKDNDLGYGIMRVDEDQTWHPFHLVSRSGTSSTWCSSSTASRRTTSSSAPRSRGRGPRTPTSSAASSRSVGKIKKQATKDYLVHPALSIPTGSFLSTLAANFTANVVRNVWSHSIIICGHFPEGVETFEKQLDRGRDPRRVVRPPDARLGQHLRLQRDAHHDRQPVHQIEHHLFPDLPSNRYAEIAPRSRRSSRSTAELLRAPAPQQVYSAWHKVVRLSLPTAGSRDQPRRNLPSQLAQALQDGHRHPEERRLIQASITREVQPPAGGLRTPLGGADRR
jgi:linoleoyl-CoA desaturase